MLIELKPAVMTVDMMKSLEDKGLIIRLCPGNHQAEIHPNESHAKTIYATDPVNGPHKLIVATINAHDPAPYFGTHVENEEFLLIGDPDTKPTYLIVALCRRKALEDKIQNHTLSAEDFVALRLKFNDPEVSFFTMFKDVPHGEVTVDQPGTCASFYVTEPRDILIDQVPLQDYELRVGPER